MSVKIAVIVVFIVLGVLSGIFKDKFSEYGRESTTNPWFETVFIAILTIFMIIGSITFSDDPLKNRQYSYLVQIMVPVIFEVYNCFRLPYSKYLWRNFENAGSSRYRDIRLLSVFPILFCPLLYVVFLLIIEDLIYFGTASTEKKKEILREQFTLYRKYGNQGLVLTVVLLIAFAIVAARAGTFLISILM